MTNARRSNWRGQLGACAIAAVLQSTPVHAQMHHMDENHLRAQYLADIETLESKFTDLAEAMSEEQYAWRPMDGVRSVSEVFMLIVAENYVVPSAWGATAPEGMTVDNSLFGSLANVTVKAEVLGALRQSFAYFKGTVGDLTPMQMHEQITFFGQERMVQEALFLISGDMHEHLGQAIAYARANHVVPPWTARRQQNQ